MNTFILVARCSTLLGLFARMQPVLLRDMRAAMDSRLHRQQALDDLYARLPNLDFSRHMLESVPDSTLHVEAVADCGWSDLGTPERIGQAISMLIHCGQTPGRASGDGDTTVDLSNRYLQSLLAAARASQLTA
ncbi:MAG: hypothetical protein JSR15_12325 [Proteobacteria bacterium]|nr:hypothetical protein [Pseudomonadota bacterium]